MLQKAPSKRPSVKSILGDIGRDMGNSFQDDDEQKNNCNHKVFVEPIPKQQTDGRDSRRTWKQTMEEAEENVVCANFGTNKSTTLSDEEVSGQRSEAFEKEGINTLVRRLEKMKEDLSDLNKAC